MGTRFISQTRWVSTTTTTKVSTTPSPLKVVRPQLLPLLRLDSVDSLHTDRDSTTISRESPSKVSTTTDSTVKPLSPPRGKKTRMPSERLTPRRRKLPKKFPSLLSKTSSLQTRFKTEFSETSPANDLRMKRARST